VTLKITLREEANLEQTAKKLLETLGRGSKYNGIVSIALSAAYVYSL